MSNERVLAFIDPERFFLVDIWLGAVVCADSFPEACRPSIREVLVIGVRDADGAVVLRKPEGDIPNDARVS